jgi:ketosteroid isomerase-like protein
VRDGTSGAAGGEIPDRKHHAKDDEEGNEMNDEMSDAANGGSTGTTFAEVAEGVRAAIAAYTQALDDGRTDDVIATFTPDAVCDLGAMGTFEGRDALRAAYAGWAPRAPQRHLVLNTLVTGWSSDAAEATSDVVFIAAGEAGWSIRLVGRYRDTLHRDGGTWRFHRRVATFETG